MSVHLELQCVGEQGVMLQALLPAACLQFVIKESLLGVFLPPNLKRAPLQALHAGWGCE